jgi:aspartate kinase
MSLIVQKYGGSSVADGEKIMNVARRIAQTAEGDNQVVAVVSAMGNTTDELLKIAYNVCDNPSKRELDVLLSTGEIVSSTLLAMALKSLGAKSISLTGAQAGIRTDNSFSKARITDIDPRRIVKELDKGNIVIVAGFQGVNEDMETTTLGRGGSDTTAVALAATLNADQCQIYTDVAGVYTADPRIVSQAKKLDEIGYEEMLEMTTYGADVMHPRAVELGQIYNIPILVASSFLDSPGTLIHGGITMEGRNRVTGIAQDLNVAKITVVGVPDKPGIAATIFEKLANAGISVDTIVQNTSIDNITDLTFTISKNDLIPAMEIVKLIADEIGARDFLFDSSVGKVSIIGTGIQTSPGYAARMFTTLSNEGINIMLISTSEIRITCIIKEDRVKDAVRALHRAFEMEQA